MHGHGDVLGLEIATPTAVDPLMGSLSPMSPAVTVASPAVTLAVPSVITSLVVANSRRQYDSSRSASQEGESLSYPPLSLGHYPEVMQGVSQIVDVPTTPSTESALLQPAFVKKIVPTSPCLESNGVYSTYPLPNEVDTVYHVRIITIAFLAFFPISSYINAV